MTSEEVTIPVCPLEKSDCEWLEEMESLRRDNSALAELAHIDNLTGLYNHRYFSIALDNEIERTRRSGRATSLILIDLDHFKKLNDRWGHEVGNLALKQTAELLHSCVRQLDVACRYGGEEFIIILPSTELRPAVMVAERIRHTLETNPLLYNEEKIPVTASVGVNTISAARLINLEEFVQATDAYLYKAKDAGRNCVRHPDIDAEEARTEVTDDERMALFS